MINARIVSSCLLAGTFSLCAIAQAGEAEKPYLGLDYSQRSYENSNSNASSATIPGIRLRAGTEINPNLAVEAHFVLGAGDDTGTIGGNTPYTIESPVTYAAFLRPQVKLDSLTLYALGGYSYVEFQYSTPLVTGNPTDPVKDFSFGAGLQFDINKQIGLNLDYIQYVQGLSAVSGGLLYHF
jgi:opacity protein-like surface antigen